MPNIKISELSAPIAVTDSDLIPGVQSGVTRRLTWGGLKSTLAGALGRSHLGLGTAAVANMTTSSTDTTAGRALKVGDFGVGATDDGRSLDFNSVVWTCFATADGTESQAAALNWPSTGLAGGTPVWFTLQTVANAGKNRISQVATECYITVPGVRQWVRTKHDTIWTDWSEVATSATGLSITVDTGSFGYGVGSGGTVTQATSKSTGVTLNKPSGQITTAPGALAASTVASFTLTNNKIGANDIPKVVIKSGATAGAYVAQVDGVAAGSCRISIRNMTAGPLSETLVLQFNIEKGAIA